MKVNQILTNSDERTKFGQVYVQEINTMGASRDELMEDTWKNALKNYEGKAPRRDYPWPEASNAFLPVTATHVEAIFSRLYNTATGQDPMFLIQPWGTGPLAQGITIEHFAEAFQEVSKWLEIEAVPMRDVLEQALLTMTKYGDSIVYLPWVKEEAVDYDLDEVSGEWTKLTEPRIRKEGPKPSVIHPTNFYIPTTETGPDAIQDAKWVAYDFEVDRQAINNKIASGWYRPEEGKKLLELLGDGEKPFTDAGDNRVDHSNDLRTETERQVGLDSEVTPRTLQMYHVWAREDLDGDGFEEEIQFEVHSKSGIIPHISYNPYKHRKRPFVHLKYTSRDGSFYSIGVPEMLQNLQNIMNQIMRDILDNNKVQNTSVFVIRKGSPIKPNLRVYPGRSIYTDDPSADFVPMKLGTGQALTNVQDLQILQIWTERRSGINDFNLGQERSGRTPATTTLALLEEANKRIDLVVRRMRDVLNELWRQVIQLYAQFGFPENVLKGLQGDEEGELVAAVIRTMADNDLQNKVVIRAQASTQNLNRSVQKQEALAMFGQLQSLYEQVLGLAQIVSQSPSNELRELALTMSKGYHEAARRIFNSFDIKDQTNINPDLGTILEVIPPGGAPLGNAEASEGSGSQVDAAQASIESLGSSAGPTNPPGRPVGGLPRVPGAAPEVDGTVG